jgi:hypothetical protein
MGPDIQIGFYCEKCGVLRNPHGEILSANTGLFKRVSFQGHASVREPGIREPKKLDRVVFIESLKKDLDSLS